MPGLLQSLFRLCFGSRMKQFDGIPGPTPSFPLGTLGEFSGKHPWDVCAEYGGRYGGMTLFWLGGTPTLILNDPALIRDVLITKFDDYYKDYPIKALKPVLKETLFNLNPPEWTALRKPHCHPLLIEGYDEWLRSQFPVIKKVVDRHQTLMSAENREFRLIDRMQRLFFDLHNSMVCGCDFEDGGFENFYAISVMATTRMKFPPPLLIPPIRPSFHRAMRLHYGAYEKAVRKARTNPDPGANDLLHVFLRQGVEIPDAQIVDFLSEFHAGGNISAAVAVVNTLHLLNSNSQIASELYAQLAQICQRNGISPESMEQVPLLDQVLRESLRMLPPIGVFGRNVRRDKSATLGGHVLPANTAVLMCTAHVQRSPSHWKDPDTFNPGRWTSEVIAANPIGSDYFFPFGRGPRMCAGAEMAMFCMRIILASVLSKAAVKTSGSFRPVLHCGVVETPDLMGRMMPHPSATTSSAG